MSMHNAIERRKPWRDDLCGGFIRRTRCGENVLCERPATHELLTGDVSQACGCERHVRDLATRFAGPTTVRPWARGTAPEAAPVCTCEAHPPGDECGYACCRCPIHRNGACASEAAPVDAEAAAVWDAMPLDEQADFVAFGETLATGSQGDRRMNARLGKLERRKLYVRHRAGNGWAWTRTPFGKRVAAHGAAQGGGK